MRIGCLQFAPQLGKVTENIKRAQDVLESHPEYVELDWLILPEMAFSGYNFPNLEAIRPYLEPTAAGPTTRWAMETARRYHCNVTVGYPELASSSAGCVDADAPRYNSTVTVSPTGQILMHYRKSFLYYTDETWAAEGPGAAAHLTNPSIPPTSTLEVPFFNGKIEGLGNISHGICMDINPYRFQLENYRKYEFATAAMAAKSSIIALSTAWLTDFEPEGLLDSQMQPDESTLFYWVGRFHPVIEASEKAGLNAAATAAAMGTTIPLPDGDSSREVMLVFANRCGVEGNARYAGTSCVLRITDGQIKILDTCGRGEEKLLVIDTNQAAKFSLI